jgi:aminopeptidase N
MKSVKRLYQEFQPERYEINLDLDRESMSFTGGVKIAGRKTGRPSRRLTLHQSGLKITSAKLVKIDKKSGEQPMDITRINTQKSFDELRLHCADRLFPGEYVVEIEFSGKITEPMHGIYPCNFKLDGKDKQLIATQFESHHAREAFPCIDEPEAKAVFSLSLKTPADETVIANTPIKHQTANNKLQTTVFEDTPRMSTYLLAFVYGELEYKESKTAGGTKVRIYATPDKTGLTDFGLEASVKSLEFFEDYFGIPYPLPKLDVIGLPDFSAGAMENWGLVTFRESVLFVDPKSSGIETKQFVCMVVSHELAHQWFGNLVTMKWWNDLWLNESFANLMEYRATDELFPEWKIWEEFTAREMGQALTRDALPNVQPVRTDVHHPDELSSVFDPAIVYAKGGCLLNMVRNLVGEDAFRSGLKTYFEEFKYRNTEAKDLWDRLGEASGIDVGSIMENWLNRPGYPVLEVDYDSKKSGFNLSQKRLTIGKTDKPSSTVWQVPLAGSQELDKPVLTTKSASLSVKKTDYPLVLNHQAHSYFVTHYRRPEHFSAILEAARQKKLETIDRLLLVQSYLLLERSGKVPTTDNLKLLASMGAEREEAVWSVLGAIIGGVRSLIDKDKPTEDKFNSILRPLAGALVKELGWEGRADDSSQTLKLRALALGMAAGANDESVINEALARFADFSKPADIAADIRSTVYFAAVRHGQKKDFAKLVKLYGELTNAEERDEIGAELTATRDPEQIKQLLEMLVSGTVRLQDVPTWFAWLMRNRYSTDLTWAWLNQNWDWIESKYSSDKSYDRFPRYSAMAFSKPEQLARYKKFFESKVNIALERPISLGIEEIEGRIEWRQKNEASVKKWLAEQA